MSRDCRNDREAHVALRHQVGASSAPARARRNATSSTPTRQESRRCTMCRALAVLVVLALYALTSWLDGATF